MRVLITGATSKQASPKSAARDVTVASLLAAALTDAGHDVEHRDPVIEEDLSDFDHAFVGLGPLHGLGTNRSYGALAVILRMWEGKLTLYLDDPDANKVLGGLRTVLNDPDKRFTKPFFEFKRQWEVAKEEPWRSWLLSGVKLLHESTWPSLLMPAFPWCDRAQLAAKVPQAAHATVPVDLSAYLPVYEPGEDEEREQRWVYEGPSDNAWWERQRPTFPVTHYGKGGDKRPRDPKLVEVYRKSWGVINPPLDHGWWTSRMGYAVQAGALYVTRWQDVQALGQAFSLLPDSAEAMDADLRQQWADAQRAAFEMYSTPRDGVKEILNSIVEPSKEKADAV